MTRPTIRKLLVANRGEIAVRILNAARELGLETYAVFTENDLAHTYNAAHAIKLPAPGSYMDVSAIVELVKRHDLDAVHPGYGFLSESAELAKRINDETDAVVIGPGTEILEQTGDKIRARRLAELCGVPTLPALAKPTDRLEDVVQFARTIGYPIMVKAVDTGGGRGIRLVTCEEDLKGLMARAIEESPSRQVFAEKAAAHGFRHVEVQIIGDLHGNVTHLWERECSIQRRYQKVVEMAPSSFTDRSLVSKMIASALSMAKKIKYVSFGTFEFLANPQTDEYYFLEVNPRLQVEHTVTESIALTDLVQLQLRLASGMSIDEAGLRDPSSLDEVPPLKSLQMRVTAEDPTKGWSLAVGRIQSFHLPSGNGIRVDSNLVPGIAAIVGSDFDPLIAKIVVSARTWDDVLAKARRALADIRIVGIATNIAMLRAIISHEDFAAGRCDTTWLEQNNASLLEAAEQLQGQPSHNNTLFAAGPGSAASAAVPTSSTTLFRKGDAWSMSIQPIHAGRSSPGVAPTDTNQQHLEITRVLRNDFPTVLSADVSITSHDSPSKAYTLHLHSTTASASAMSSKHRRGSPRDPSHVIIPFSGKLVEVLVDMGQTVKKGDVIVIVKQMKTELEVRTSQAGKVTWVTEAEDDEDVAEGVLAAIVEVEGKATSKL